MYAELVSMCRSSDAEKRALLKTISTMSKLAEERRRQGLLYLDEIVNSIENNMLKIAVKLVFVPCDANFIGEVLKNIIIAEECGDGERLEKILISEAVMQILDNRSGEEVKISLLSMLGEEWVEAYMDYDNYSLTNGCGIFKEERIAVELIVGDTKDDGAKTKWLYQQLLGGLNKILKSNIFLDSLAVIYCKAEIQGQESPEIVNAAETILLHIDEQITSKLISGEYEWYETKRTAVRRLLNFMSHREFIIFDDVARFAIERAVIRPGMKGKIDRKKISNMKYEFPERITEFLRLIMIFVLENDEIYDFKIIFDAIIKTVVQGGKALDISKELKRDI